MTTTARQKQIRHFCVRCHREGATPYLRKHISKFPKSGNVLDIGCGNGRNSDFMKTKGYDVTSVDMVPSYQGAIRLTLGHDPLPGGTYDIFLANYVLMFLSPDERIQVMSEICRHSKPNSVIVIELFPAKKAYPCNIQEIVDFFTYSGSKYEVIHRVKERCILQKRGD